MRRVLGSEKMDSPTADPELLQSSLDDLRSVNRWLGGHRSAVRSVLQLARAAGRKRLSLLDVATGGADIPAELRRVAARRGLDVEITATDNHPVTLEYARRATAADPGIRVEAADALNLPYPDNAFDIGLCCMALHHFTAEAAVRILRELGRVSSVGFVVTDLRRSLPGYIGAKLLAGTAWSRNPITRHDGPASVHAAFTVEEMAQWAIYAGYPNAVVRREPVFRLVLVARHAAPQGRNAA